METMNFQAPQPPLQPSPEVMRKIAYEKVFSNFKEKRDSMGAPESFSAHGRQYEIKNNIDRSVAEGEMRVRAMESVLEDAVRGGDYRTEQAAAKFLELFRSYDNFARVYAEILASQPQLAKELDGEIDHLKEIINEKELNAG